MDGHTYVTDGYSDYNDFPFQEGGYAYEPEQHVDWYVIETRVERGRVPASHYTKFDGVPLKNKLPGKHVFKRTPKDHHEAYKPLSRSDHDNSSLPRYHEEENLMANFLNKLHIGKRSPTKISDPSSPSKYRPTSPTKYRPISPDKYHPASPNKYRPTSQDKYLPTNQNMYRPTSPDKYYPTSPNEYSLTSSNKYRPSSPYKYYPTNPNKYDHTSSNKYPPTSPDKYYPTSPNKYDHTSSNKYPPTSPDKYYPTNPNKYDHTSSNKYPPTIPDKYYPTSPNKYVPTSSNKYRPTSPYKYRPTNPDKYHPTSPNKYSPTSPDKYQPTVPSKHQPTSPTHGYPSKDARMVKPQTLLGRNSYGPTSPTRYRPTSPTHDYPSKEYQTHGSPDMLDPNYHWQSAGPPTTRRPLTTPTNNINEALGFLMESVNYSQRSKPNREGSFDNLAPRAQTIGHEKRYTRPAFEGITNRSYVRSDVIYSEEAVRRFNGAYVR